MKTLGRSWLCLVKLVQGIGGDELSLLLLGGDRWLVACDRSLDRDVFGAVGGVIDVSEELPRGSFCGAASEESPSE
jgi:hypothetical protein